MPQRALVIDRAGLATVHDDHPIPEVGPDEILIRTKAVALNPIDYKHVDGFGVPGCQFGCDYAGTVEQVGSMVENKFPLGCKVAGMIHGGNSNDPRAGAFAEHVVAVGDLQFRIPDDMSFEEAAAIGTAINTATQALYQHLNLPLPDQQASNDNIILVYGGATAIGTMAIQFAKLSGLKVVTTCAPRNFQMVKEYGADAVFDYREAGCGKRINNFTNNQLENVFDAISIGSSVAICMEAIGVRGGTYVSTRAAILELSRKDVKLCSMIAFTAIGKPFSIVPGGSVIPIQHEHRNFAARFVSHVETLLKDGKLKPHPQEIGKNGLQGILEGIQRLREENVRGVKLVYRIDN